MEEPVFIGDWLQEHGDARGEFIALQFKSQKTPAEVKREKELLKLHGKKCIGMAISTMLAPSGRWVMTGESACAMKQSPAACVRVRADSGRVPPAGGPVGGGTVVMVVMRLRWFLSGGCG